MMGGVLLPVVEIKSLSENVHTCEVSSHVCEPTNHHRCFLKWAQAQYTTPLQPITQLNSHVLMPSSGSNILSKEDERLNIYKITTDLRGCYKT